MDLRTAGVLALGGAAGTLGRAAVSAWALKRWGPAFPWGTLIVNAAGCFAIGLIGTLTQRGSVPESARTLLVTGMLGAFTTFSAFGFETWGLVQAGRWGAAGMNVGASLALGFLALGAGVAAAKALP